MLDLVTVLVPDYDAAIRFFVEELHFVLEQDRPARTTDGRAKRWVVVRPRDGGCGLLLARADGDAQHATVGAQWGGRVGLFLRVDDLPGTLERLRTAGAMIEGAPRAEAYGTVVVFRDPWGNRWDLLGAAG